MESKYLTFVKNTVPGRKTPIVHVMNKETTYLGTIYFNPGWRKYVFEPEANIIFDSGCLTDIITQLNELTKEWREGLKKWLQKKG